MKAIALLNVAVALGLVLASPEARQLTVDDDGRIILSAEEVAACNRQGGCTIVTRQYLEQIKADAIGECKAPRAGLAT